MQYFEELEYILSFIVNMLLRALRFLGCAKPLCKSVNTHLCEVNSCELWLFYFLRVFLSVLSGLDLRGSLDWYNLERFVYS